MFTDYRQRILGCWKDSLISEICFKGNINLGRVNCFQSRTTLPCNLISRYQSYGDLTSVIFHCKSTVNSCLPLILNSIS